MEIAIKDVGIGTIAAIIGALIMLGGAKVTDPDVFVCEDRGIAMPCEDLTTYYGLPNGKCINPELGNKVCRSGWTDKYRDFIPSENIAESTSIFVSANNKDWICETDNSKVNSYSRCQSEGKSSYLGELI